MKRKSMLVAALMVVLAVCVGCDPGWVNPVLGSGDGTGTTPDGPPGVANAEVALGSPWALVDLGQRGYLVYDGDTCTILRVAGATTTRFAGNGTCGVSGDGGPALDASIDVVPTPLGSGLQADEAGNVYFVQSDDASIRRIDAATGAISTVVAEPGGFVFGIAAAAGDGFVYLVERTVQVQDGDTVFDEPQGQLRRVDADGDVLVATLDSEQSASMIGFARVGVDHYVTIGLLDDGSQIRVDIVDDTATSTLLADGLPVLIPETADADGNLFGITMSRETGGLDGNQVFRMRPDGSVDLIAGSGISDPGTRRQTGAGSALDLTANVVASTRNGNLLIGSGHTVYNLFDAADAPAVPTPLP